MNGSALEKNRDLNPIPIKNILSFEPPSETRTTEASGFWLDVITKVPERRLDETSQTACLSSFSRSSLARAAARVVRRRRRCACARTGRR